MIDKKIEKMLNESDVYIVVTRKGLAINGSKPELMSMATATLHSFYQRGIIDKKDLKHITDLTVSTDEELAERAKEITGKTEDIKTALNKLKELLKERK